MATSTGRAFLLCDDGADVASIYVEDRGDALLRDADSCQFSNCNDRVMAQFVRRPQLLRHVLHVVGMRAFKQMRRIAAAMIVTVMAHIQLRRAMRKFPRQPVRADGLSFSLHPAIPGVHQAGPQPTGVVWAACDLRPKTVFQYLSGIHATRGMAFQVLGWFTSEAAQRAMRSRIGLREFSAPTGTVSWFHSLILARSTS